MCRSNSAPQPNGGYEPGDEQYNQVCTDNIERWLSAKNKIIQRRKQKHNPEPQLDQSVNKIVKIRPCWGRFYFGLLVPVRFQRIEWNVKSDDFSILRKRKQFPMINVVV